MWRRSTSCQSSLQRQWTNLAKGTRSLQVITVSTFQGGSVWVLQTALITAVDMSRKRPMHIIGFKTEICSLQSTLKYTRKVEKYEILSTACHEHRFSSSILIFLLFILSRLLPLCCYRSAPFSSSYTSIHCWSNKALPFRINKIPLILLQSRRGFSACSKQENGADLIFIIEHNTLPHMPAVPQRCAGVGELAPHVSADTATAAQRVLSS